MDGAGAGGVLLGSVDDKVLVYCDDVRVTLLLVAVVVGMVVVVVVVVGHSDVSAGQALTMGGLKPAQEFGN